MASAAPVSTAAARRSSSRLARILLSSIGLKLIMAATGVILSGFVLGHMIGNLKAFEGAEALNAYGKLLHFEPALLWGVRFVLLGSIGLHIASWILLFRSNQAARPKGYQVVKRKEASLASLSMRVTGPLIVAFVIFHILHLTTGTVHPSFKEGDVYGNVVSGLRAAPVALIYVLAMICLGFHLWHGVWSLFQTLGAGQPRYSSFGRHFATVFTLVVVLGFIAVPLSVLAGVVK